MKKVHAVICLQHLQRMVDRLFKFREFKEDEFGLRYKMRLTDEWPFHEAVLYRESGTADIWRLQQTEVLGKKTK